MRQFESLPRLISLKEGESLFQSIISYASSINLKSGIFTGIGALSDITMSFYHREQHTKRLFQGTYELASLTGM